MQTQEKTYFLNHRNIKLKKYFEDFANYLYFRYDQGYFKYEFDVKSNKVFVTLILNNSRTIKGIENITSYIQASDINLDLINQLNYSIQKMTRLRFIFKSYSNINYTPSIGGYYAYVNVN